MQHNLILEMQQQILLYFYRSFMYYETGELHRDQGSLHALPGDAKVHRFEQNL